MSTVIKVAVIVAVLYSVLARGSVGVCAGGYDAEGFIDGTGSPTSLPPLCLSVSFLPSILVYGLIAAIAIATHFVVCSDASGSIRHRVTAVAVVALIAVGITGTALQFAPMHQGIITDWIENRTFQTPPLSNVVVEITPAPDQAG